MSTQQITIQQFLDDMGIPYLHNYDYIRKGKDGKNVKNGGTVHSDYNEKQIKTANQNLKVENLGEDYTWVNAYYKFRDDIFILDIDDTTLTVEEINNKVEEVFGFVPPYTLSANKKRPHYILIIDNFPKKSEFNFVINCFIPFQADLLTHVVEKRTNIIYTDALNSNNEIEFTPLDWNTIKNNFFLNGEWPTPKPVNDKPIPKEATGQKDKLEQKEEVVNGCFQQQIEFIKASKYYNEAFDLENIKVESETHFRFKATSRYDCLICNREHIKNSNSIYVDCSKNGISMTCRPHTKAVFIKDRETFKTKQECLIDFDDKVDNLNIVDYVKVKLEFERDNLHFYCGHTKKFYKKEVSIDKSIHYNPHTAQEFKTANGNIYYDEVTTKMTKDGERVKIEKKCFIDRWIKDATRREILDFDYNVDPDYKPNNDYINLWDGFDILKTDLVDMTQDEKDKIIGVVDKFFNNLGGSSSNAKDISKYFKNWVAHIIQFPHIKQITVPYLQSDEEGAGKTTLPVFIGSILGDENCLKYVIISNGFDELNEQFTNNLRDCFVFCADELRVEDGTANYSKFKKETSAPTRKINTKYGEVVMISNKIQMCITSNNISAIPIPKNQRRLVASELTTELHQQDWFRQCFYPLLKNKATCRFIYEYFKTLDLSDYNVGDIPESDYSKLVSESSKDLIEKYIDANYSFLNSMDEEIFGESLFNHYNNWCEKNRIKPQSASSIGMRMAKNKYAKLIFNKRRTKDGFLYCTNKDEVAKYFNTICDIEL